MYYSFECISVHNLQTGVMVLAISEYHVLQLLFVIKLMVSSRNVLTATADAMPLNSTPIRRLLLAGYSGSQGRMINASRHL